MSKAERDIKRKLRVLTYAEMRESVARTSRHFGIARQTFYNWKSQSERFGNEGLIDHRPCPENPAFRVAPEIEEKIIYLRTTYNLGLDRISWFIQRYDLELKVSESMAHRVLRRQGLNRLPCNAKVRTVQTKRYEKRVPGHHIQVDVKFLTCKNQDDTTVKRFQYTAINDVTRIRALNI